MKMKLLMTMSILAIAIQFTAAARAQDEEQGQRGRRWEQRLANLSQEEREKLHAAHRKAMQEPYVQAAQQKMRAARKEYRDAMRAAMLKTDPSIQPILNKIPPPNRGG